MHTASAASAALRRTPRLWTVRAWRWRASPRRLRAPLSSWRWVQQPQKCNAPPAAECECVNVAVRCGSAMPMLSTVSTFNWCLVRSRLPNWAHQLDTSTHPSHPTPAGAVRAGPDPVHCADGGRQRGWLHDLPATGGWVGGWVQRRAVLLHSQPADGQLKLNCSCSGPSLPRAPRPCCLRRS